MGLVLLQFVPLALAAVTPGMMIFVTALLVQDGNAKRAFAVALGRYVGLLGTGLVALFALHQLPDVRDSGKLDQREAIPVIFLIIGIGLMIASVYSLSAKKDPSDPKKRSILTLLKGLNAPFLFVACLVTTFISLRQLSLLIAGTAIIRQSSNGRPAEISLMIILCLALLWPLLIPLGIKVGMGAKGDELLERLRAWMDLHQKGVNATVMAFFGGLLVAKGISGI